MATTRSSAAERAKKFGAGAGPAGIGLKSAELTAMLGASFTVFIGLLLAFWAKTSAPVNMAARRTDNPPLNINALANREQIPPYLTFFSSAIDRDFAAKKLYDFVKDASGELPNVGALAALTVTESEIASNPKLELYSTRLRERKKKLEEENKKRAARGEAPEPKEIRLPLFTAGQFGQLKPAFVVRSREQFRSRLLFWAMIYFAGFYAIYLIWRARRFSGDVLLLPAIHLLTGIGLTLMISFRDPLRDRMDFVEFAQGSALGCAVMLALSLGDYARMRRLTYIPLIAALMLSIALIGFGAGPTGSDAKVNLFGAQPIEAIKILSIFFLSGFFADRWLGLRALSARPPSVSGLPRLFEPPRAKDFIPVVVGMGVILFFFLLQKDLGPALILACAFLTLYAVARLRLSMAVAGLALVTAGFWVSYRLGFPRTVSDRIRIWLSPWDNAVGGGVQLVHSFWAMSTGSLTGTGVGLGDAEIVPAVHTDLILAAVGEELGFVGLLAVFALYALIIWRGFRIALGSSGDYTFFLALGLILLIALQIFLIAGGTLGIVPLSGVVSPFLSFGKSSAIANFAITGILLGVSARPGDASRRKELNQNFGAPVKWTGAVFATLMLALLAKAAYLQVIRDDQTLIAGTLSSQGDGKLRYQYNPRLERVARQIPQGSVYDRNNVPLATSSWEELERHRKEYERLGVEIDAVCSRRDERHYPFGGLTFHLLGDRRTRVNWSARNTSYVERDSRVRLIGYDDNATAVEAQNPDGEDFLTIRRDYAELIPLLRYRYRPDHDSVRRFINRERGVRMSIDIVLEQRVAAILKDKIERAGKERGAAVVMDADTGDLLASVSYPWPQDLRSLDAAGEDGAYADAAEALYDRARWGVYPPGSTFKIVTAIAALTNNPQTIDARFECRGLGARQGNYARGWKRPIYDDESGGASGHGAVNLERGIVESCNAYFAQLAVNLVGADAIFQTASRMEIEFTRGDAKTRAKILESLRDDLPQVAFGQGVVFATPFQMARVAATVGAGGNMPFGRWVTDDSNSRNREPARVLTHDQAGFLGRAMRGVALGGSARSLSGSFIPIAGKTGTAENRPGEASHSWFIGFAPYGEGAGNRIAFSVIVENGGYGGALAAPIAAEIVAAAFEKPAANNAESAPISASGKTEPGGRSGNPR